MEGSLGPASRLSLLSQETRERQDRNELEKGKGIDHAISSDHLLAERHRSIMLHA